MAIAAMGVSGQKIRRPLLLLGIGALVFLLFNVNPINDGLVATNLRAHTQVISRKLQSIQKAKPDDFVILTTEMHELESKMGGYLFKETGRTYFVNADVKTSLLHSFSPYIENEARKRFLDPPHDNIYFANSPAVTWFKGELVLVARIWLDREKYEPKNTWPSNHFADNYLYTQKFDRHLRPTNNGSIIGIPAPKQWWVGDGPIEPRLAKVKDKLFITFNAAMAFKPKLFMDFTIMWDYEQNIPIIPEIKGGTPMLNQSKGTDDMPRDKHWMALVQNDELYFVHNLDPLRAMKCSMAGFCEFVYTADKNGVVFSDHIAHLRGGTPFELYEYPYYIGVAHSTMYKRSNNHRYYTAHIVVLRVDPYRIVYVSDDIKVHDEIYRAAPMVRPRWIDDGFIFPVGLILESKDWMTIGVHVNDFNSILIRMKGLQKLMRTVIKLDKRQNAQGGPPVNYLHKHIHDTQQNLTHTLYTER